MRVVLQRSKEASVTVDGEIVGQIPFGLTLLVGITHEDTEKDATYIAEKSRTYASLKMRAER